MQYKSDIHSDVMKLYDHKVAAETWVEHRSGLRKSYVWNLLFFWEELT